MTLRITTYTSVPESVAGYVRDLRVVWAAEEAGLPWTLETVPLRPKSPDHLARQPFGQVPILHDTDVELWESGACVLHLAEGSEALMPTDPAARAETLSWLFAALNSIEPLVLYWQMTTLFEPVAEAGTNAAARLGRRLGQLEEVLSARDFIAAGRFTVADILMTEVLRMAVDDDAPGAGPAIRGYVARMTDRPAFRRAHADQLARYAA